jgi:hypothetical protein
LMGIAALNPSYTPKIALIASYIAIIATFGVAR